MDLHAIALKALFTISALIGIQSVRLGPHVDLWQTSGAWKNVSGHLSFQAESTAIPDLCRGRSGGVIEFPAVIQGAHEFRVDGHLIERFGDRSFASVDRFYGRPVVDCELLTNAKSFSWTVTSFAEYFARINDLPTVTDHPSNFNLFAETFHTAAGGALIIMALYTLFLFQGAVAGDLMVSVVLSCVLMSLYFFACASHDFGFTLNMLGMHKIADASMWLGVLTLLNAYRLEGLTSRASVLSYFAAGAVGLLVIFLGRSGDEVQLGTTICGIGGLANILALTFSACLREFRGRGDSQKTLQTLSLLAYSCGWTYELTVITGLSETPPLLPIAQVGGFLCLILSVNQKIRVTYRERDHLRANLELEVTNKTSELTLALGELKSTQAELVQSAKLASLGTLSAGIAHEINNSLNFVNGALYPLQKIVTASPDLKDNVKVTKLFGAMNEGMRLSIEIVASLRNYTGLNQAKFNDLRVLTVVKSVLVILKSRLGDRINVELDVPQDISIFGSVVGLNQVFMNLITNAIDAMPERGLLTIKATDLGDRIEIIVADSGGGIPQHLIDRVFEPFFTTKEVGKGTGLGLHIVRSEMEKHKGKVVVTSLATGTTFALQFPKVAGELAEEQKGDAA